MNDTDRPTAAMLVIGDEILSGRTRDANMHHLAGILTEVGAPLREVRVVPDEQADIVAALNALRERFTYVFTSGGIGPTHDDITADAVSAAFGVSVGVRQDARDVLLAHYGDESKLTEARLRMARIPEGAELIANPVSGAPGFRIGNVFVMAGVPAIFNAMVESVRPQLRGGPPVLSHSFRVPMAEGDLAAPLARLAERFPDIAFGSYPYYQGGYGAVLVARSADREALTVAAQALRDMVRELGAEGVTELPPT